MEIFWLAITIVSVVLYIFLAQFIFPSLFLKFKHSLKEANDRGLICIEEPKGRILVCEPSSHYRRGIMPRYIISQRDGKKVFSCKVDKNIIFIDFDIVVFNHKRKIIGVINVKENITSSLVVPPVALPTHAAFVSVIVNSANGIKPPIKESLHSRIGASRVFFSVSVFLLSIIQVFIVKLCLSQIFLGVFVYDFNDSLLYNSLTFICGILLAAVQLFFNYLHIKKHIALGGENG